MSHDRDRAIRRFIVKHIQDQDLPEDNGVLSRTLIHLCLERFCDGVEDDEVIKEKNSIVDVMRGMIQDGMLKPVRSNNKTAFRLDPYFNYKDKMNPTASQPSEDPQSTQEALEALDKETSPDVEEQQEEQQEEEQEERVQEEVEEQIQQEVEEQQAEQAIERTEAIRHSKAYAEMTRGAAPLPRAYSDEDIETPSRKRRKILEIATSDASSSFDPISPGRYPNSTPQRTMKRLGTPLSGSRRRSAPTGMLFSPSKRLSPRYTEQRFFKEEKTDNSPVWLKAAVNALRSKYPESSIISENGQVKCLDCEGRFFKPAGNGSLHNIHAHLRSKTHQDKAAYRLEKLGPSESYFPTTVTSMDFDIPQGPVMVFAHPGQQNLATLRTQYLDALEKDAQQKAIRTTVVEARITEIQKRNKDHVERVEASLAIFERRNAEQQELISDLLTSSEDRHKELSREVADRVNSVEEKSKKQLKEIEARIARSEDQSTSKIDVMNTKLARSDLRNIDKIETLTDLVKESEKKTEERLLQFTIDVEQIETLADRFKQSEKNIDERLLGLAMNIDQIDTLAERIKESERKTEERLLRLDEKIRDLQRINEGQNEAMNDLESQYQLLTEALQRQQSDKESFQKSMSDQMEAHLQQTEKLMANFEKNIAELLETKMVEQQAADRRHYEQQIAEQLRIMEQQAEQIQKLEKQFSNKILSSERKIAEQQEYIKRFEVVLPAVLEDLADLREFAQDIERRTASRQTVSPTTTRLSMTT